MRKEKASFSVTCAFVRFVSRSNLLSIPPFAWTLFLKMRDDFSDYALSPLRPAPSSFSSNDAFLGPFSSPSEGYSTFERHWQQLLYLSAEKPFITSLILRLGVQEIPAYTDQFEDGSFLWDLSLSEDFPRTYLTSPFIGDLFPMQVP